MALSGRWRLLRDHPRLRKIVVMKMKQHGYNAEQLCKELGIYPYKLNRYLNNKTPSLTDYEIVILGKKLGIQVKVDIEIINRDE